MSGWTLVRARARIADTAVAAIATLLGVACLVPLFDGMEWVLPAVLALAVVAITGAACRAIALPLPLIPLTEVLTSLLVITGLFASDLAWAKVVPTTEAWRHIDTLVGQGMFDAQTLIAPVPVAPAVVLLAVGGTALAALAVDCLFVCVRSPILAGLPLLTLFLGSAVMLFGSAPWWLIAPPASGWLLLLAADQRERVREWGGLPGLQPVRGYASAARRTGFVIVLAALAIGLLLPVRNLSSWLGGNGTGNGAEAADAAPIVLDPLVSMRRDLLLASDKEVLRYRTTDPNPPYLRVTALEAFDGVTWSARPAMAQGRVAGLPLPGTIVDRLSVALPEYHVNGGESHTFLFSITNLRNSYLPLPYPVMEVADLFGLRSNWRLDPETGTAFSDETPATGLRYGVTAVDGGLLPDQLRRAEPPLGQLWPQLSVPGGISPEVRATAAKVTAAARTPYDKAVALQNWFSRDGGFTYSTSVRSGADADYLTEFLKDKVGYCEQYAAAMALMARTLGIPSRVVVGFTQGTQLADKTWQVTVRDAHAWPELWFDQVGWVRFEPTPSSNATVRAPAYAPYPNAGPAGDEKRVPREDLRQVASSAPTSHGDLRWAGFAGGAAAALLLLAIPALLRMLRRRRRLHAKAYAQMVEGSWQELADTAADLHQPWSPFATPRQAAERLGRGLPATAEAALTRIRQEVEQVRYGRTAFMEPASARERSGAVRADVTTVRMALLDRVRWQTRLLSYCWPPSARRRQRSSSRSMNPGPFAAGGASAPASAGSSTALAPNAE